MQVPWQRGRVDGRTRVQEAGGLPAGRSIPGKVAWPLGELPFLEAELMFVNVNLVSSHSLPRLCLP